MSMTSMTKDELSAGLDNLLIHRFASTVSHRRWIAAAHLKYLSLILTNAFLKQQGVRIAVSMPPRHGKSELMSRRLPEWLLYWRPESRIILSSYEAGYAAEWGRKVRDDLNAESSFFGFGVRNDSSAADHWETTKGGSMITAGAGGAITGRGADLFIIDDPIKNAEEAASPTRRNTIWDWYTSTAYTRLEPNANVVLMMTRWNEDDLYGRIKAEQPKKWVFINVPAISENEDDPLKRPIGEALWPQRYDVPALMDIKDTLGSYYWSALYRGSPIPQEGTMFKREWFKIVDDYPKGFWKTVRYWDLAATEKKRSDYTAGGKMMNKGGRYWMLDMKRDQLSPLGVENLIKQTAQLDGYGTEVWMEEEMGSGGKNTTDKYRREVLNAYTFLTERPSTDKVSRARGFSASAEAGNVFLVRNPDRDWITPFLDELCAFPFGAHDDQVDAASGSFRQVSDTGSITVLGNDRR